MTISKPYFPTTTAHAIRLCLFQATRRPRQLRGETVRTPWGTIKIWGRLGQQHADVLDAICFEREKRGDYDDGRIKLLVDPAKVRRRSGQVSGSTFAAVLKDLEQAVIEIIEPAHLACSGHLIDHIDLAVRGDGTPVTRFDPLSKGERQLWRVELGKAFCKLVAKDIWVGYDPAQLSHIGHGISQAVARHVLTHKVQPNGGWKLDTVIRVVAGDLSSQAVRDRRRELHADAADLRDAGITIDGDRVKHSRETSVEHKPGGVEHKPGGVEHKPGAWSISLESAVTDSVSSDT